MSGDGDPEVPPGVYGALQASGFPFQTAVESVVRQSDGWRVVAVEFPWQDASGDQFLDLVVSCEGLYLAVECKKTQKEMLTFLQPRRSAGGRTEYDRAQLLYSRQIDDMTHRLELYCGQWNVAPMSAEATFCVLSTSASGRDQRMLERDAQRVVRATDAFALKLAAEFRPGGAPEPDHAFIPIVVTNAAIFVARYEPSEVSLDTGEFAGKPRDITAAHWVRFRKPFTSSAGVDLGDRTVFVVQATALSEFLHMIQDSGGNGPVKHELAKHLPRKW